MTSPLAIFALPVDDDHLEVLPGDGLLVESAQASLDVLLLVVGGDDDGYHVYTLTLDAAFLPDNIALSMLKYSHSPNLPMGMMLLLFK
jgi:hypothetical protein